MKSLYKIALTILLMSAIWSCGARRTAKERTELKSKKTDTVAVQLKKGSEIATATAIKSSNTVNATFNEQSLTVSPVDPAKPSSYTNAAGQTVSFQNALITTGKRNGNTVTDTKTEVAVSVKQKDTTAAKMATVTHNEINLEQSSKATERESIFTNLWFWIGLAAAICIVLVVFWWLVFGRKKKE